MAILGLMTSEQVSTYRPKSIRRSVFHLWPNGTSPLMGLLSLLKEEVTNDPEYKWWEKRFVEQRTTLAYISTTVAFYSAVSADFGTWTTATGDVTFTAGTQYGIKVAAAGTALFRVGNVIKFNAILAAGGTTEVHLRITYVDATNVRMAGICLKTTGAVDYDGAHTGYEVLIYGNAAAEGSSPVTSSAALSTLNPMTTPIQLYNYTQIFTTEYQITGTALKTSLWYDEAGPLPEQAKDAAVNHNQEMEKSFLFGERYENVISSTNIVRHTGGVLYFLRSWEDGSTYLSSAPTADTDDNKRIITNSGGTMSRTTYHTYLERFFRNCRNKANELLVLCGSGYLLQMNEMYAGSSSLNADLPITETWGMNVVSHLTPFGRIYYKTHPLFNINATLRYNALFIDPGAISYRYLAGRDTEHLKMPVTGDFVTWRYLTEAGLELHSPESFGYIQNVTGWQA